MTENAKHTPVQTVADWFDALLLCEPDDSQAAWLTVRVDLPADAYLAIRELVNPPFAAAPELLEALRDSQQYIAKLAEQAPNLNLALPQAPRRQYHRNAAAIAKAGGR